MTERERALCLALGRCSFPTASFSKRFAKDLSDQAVMRGEITAKQAARLEIQAWIYRRQMPAELLPDSAPAGYETPTQRWAAPVGKIVEALKTQRRGDAEGAEEEGLGENIQHPMDAGAGGGAPTGGEDDGQLSML